MISLRIWRKKINPLVQCLHSVQKCGTNPEKFEAQARSSKLPEQKVARVRSVVFGFEWVFFEVRTETPDSKNLEFSVSLDRFLFDKILA